MYSFSKNSAGNIKGNETMFSKYIRGKANLKFKVLTTLSNESFYICIASVS